MRAMLREMWEEDRLFGAIALAFIFCTLTMVVWVMVSSPLATDRIAECEQFDGTVIYDRAMRFDGCQVDGER